MITILYHWFKKPITFFYKKEKRKKETNYFFFFFFFNLCKRNSKSNS